MPFDYAKYEEKCNSMSAEELQKEWENYTRQISAGATSTATSVLLMPLTGGISAVGLGLSAPRIHNARKKREIIEAGLKARGTTHRTRTGDVLAPMAVSGVIGGLTLGLAPPGASDFAAVAAVRAVEMAATNTALNATEVVVVSNARKKMADEAKLHAEQSQEQDTRYGSLAVPFLMEEAVLPSQHLHYLQPSQQTCGVEASATVIQASPGDIKTQVMYVQNQQDPAASLPLSSLSIKDSTDAGRQTTINQAALATSDAASISSRNLNDISCLAPVDEEYMPRTHALALVMEKREENGPLGLSLSQVEPYPRTQAEAAGGKTSQFTPSTQPQPLESAEVTQALTNEMYQPDVQEEWSGLRPRQGPHSATLPARYDMPHSSSPSNQHSQNSFYPPQPLPPYQPQFFIPTYQESEPKQYYPSPEPQQQCPPSEPQQHHAPPASQQYYTPPAPPPPQQRQDSGYGSMYSIHSISNTPQETYYPLPYYSSPQMYHPPTNFVSRHSSIPQSYQHPSVAQKPMPYHPVDPNSYHQQMPMNQGHRGSESSLYPMTPPPPYYPPPPGMPSTKVNEGKDNDYFNYAAAPPPPPAPSVYSSQFGPFNPLLQQPQKLVDGMSKGWQWARTAALPIKMPVDSKTFMEPNYGPAPAVPTAWKGS